MNVMVKLIDIEMKLAEALEVLRFYAHATIPELTADQLYQDKQIIGCKRANYFLRDLEKE